jgi:tetratricopeptide (TPR) repeat protein
MKQFIGIIGTLFLLVKIASAGPWSEAQTAAGAGEYEEAVRLLLGAVDAGTVSSGDVARYETQAFLWRRGLGEGREALDRLLELPTRTTVGLESAALALGDYLAETPAGINLWFEAVERHAEWRLQADNLAGRLLERNALEAAARVAGAEPTRCRSVLNDLARHPKLAELALASYEGNPYGLDLGTWRVWLRLVESARNPESAVEEALLRVERDPDRVEFRREASERLRGLGRAGEALSLWENQDGSRDDRVYVERGECLYALGRVEDAVADWRAKLNRDNLRPGDVRTVARIFTDHGLNEAALELLENPPTGIFRDYARDIARLLFSLERYREAAETCAEATTLEGTGSWSFDFFVDFGQNEEAALAALGVIGGREEPLFGRIRLHLALSPWALELAEEGPGPLPHPWRESKPVVELDERARRTVEDELERLEIFFEKNTDAVNRLSGSGGLLPFEVVEILGQTGLPELALDSALRLSSFEGLTPEGRGAIAASGLAHSTSTPNIREIDADEVLALNPADRELKWRLALYLLRGGRPDEAERLLAELAGGRGLGPDEGNLLAARIEAALLRGRPKDAWELVGGSPEDIDEPRHPELHYQLTLLQLHRLAEELERDRSSDPSRTIEWIRRYVALNGDDPRATELLRLVLVFGLVEDDGGMEGFVELVEAHLAGSRGDTAGEELHLGKALGAGGPLGAEAAVQLADLLAERRDYSDARETLREVSAEGIEGTSDRALALVAWLDADFLGETEAARNALTALINGYPGSVLLEYARRGLAALEES